ncbi:hypothetical protein [Nonomuraea dietziae]|uniref:hypothetical protein n=1 Tax=Nonomuraea dietziae TaxID=65515 RepID=UPI0031CF2647
MTRRGYGCACRARGCAPDNGAMVGDARLRTWSRAGVAPSSLEIPADSSLPSPRCNV